MKKLVLILLVLVQFYFTTSVLAADYCTIKGTNDDTVQVFSSEYKNGMVDITLGSDSQYAATIDVTVTVIYKHGYSEVTKNYSDKCIAEASTKTPISIEVPAEITENNWTYKYDSYSISLSGIKCSN